MSRPETPLLTVDIIIRLTDREDRPLVLIERKNPPHGLALPGGFVEVGETLEQAAVREAAEETGLQVELNSLLGCYSNPARDPRGHTVSAVYIATAHGEPQAADDAQAIRLVDPEESSLKLVFDHALILADYRRYLASGKGPSPRI